MTVAQLIESLKTLPPDATLTAVVDKTPRPLFDVMFLALQEDKVYRLFVKPTEEAHANP